MSDSPTRDTAAPAFPAGRRPGPCPYQKGHRRLYVGCPSCGYMSRTARTEPVLVDEMRRLLND